MKRPFLVHLEGLIVEHYVVIVGEGVEVSGCHWGGGFMGAAVQDH